MTDTATTLTDAEAAEFRQKCVDFMEQFAPGQNPLLLHAMSGEGVA